MNKQIKDIEKELDMVEQEYSDKDIIDNMDIPFQPMDDRILIKPLEPVMITKEITEIDYEATPAARKEADEKGEDIPEAVTKTETKEVESNLRIGVVLAMTEAKWTMKVNTAIPQYEVGVKVVYVHKLAMPFELFKDSVLLKKYDILGKWLG